MDEVVRLTLAEAATVLGVSEEELKAIAGDGQVPFTYAEDGALRFRRKDVEFYAFRLTWPKKPRQGT
jgi:hypothetical protein